MSKPTVTIDRNILLAAGKSEAQSEDARSIVKAHNEQLISVGLSAANRVDLGGSDRYSLSESQFQAELDAAGLFEPEILPFPLDWDHGLWEQSVTGDDIYELVDRIAAIVFPVGLKLDSSEVDLWKRFSMAKRNVKCDIYAIWSHTFMKRDYFVSNDKRFWRGDRAHLLSLIGARGVCSSQDFISELERIRCAT